MTTPMHPFPPCRRGERWSERGAALHPVARHGACLEGSVLRAVLPRGGAHAYGRPLAGSRLKQVLPGHPRTPPRLVCTEAATRFPVSQ